MAKDFLFVNNDGDYEEAASYQQSDFISTSAGVADAGKPIVLNASGKVDPSMVDTVTDHGDLTGLGDDDHTQYLLVNGTRAMSGALDMGSFKIINLLAGVAANDAVNVGQLDAAIDGVTSIINNFEWQPSVIDKDLTAPPGSPNTGDRYLIGLDTTAGVATGAWAGKDGQIAEWNGTSWDFIIPTTGSFVAADDEGDKLYLFGSTAWDAKYFESTTASTGLTKVGFDIQLASSAAGAGLGFSAGVLSVNVDDSSIEITGDSLNVKALGITNAMLAGSISDDKLLQDYIQTSEVDDSSIEFVANQLRVKADGIKDTMIDFGTGAGQVSAADIPVADTNNYFTGTDQEAVNNELFVLASESTGEIATAGVGGVQKGDLLYFSAADTVSIMPINASHRCIGVALSNASAGNDVKFVRTDESVEGVLVGATAGTRYYWDGADLVTSIPSGSGAYVWAAGVAKNATDLLVDIEFIKRNN